MFKSAHQSSISILQQINKFNALARLQKTAIANKKQLTLLTTMKPSVIFAARISVMSNKSQPTF